MSTIFRTVATLASTGLALLTGCGSPDCSVEMPLSGSIEGVVAYASRGDDFCQQTRFSADGIIALELYRELSVGFTGVESLQVNLMASELSKGVFPALVSFPEGSRTFTTPGYDCTLTVTEFETENWTVTDFVVFTGVLQCPDPVPMVAGSAEVTLAPTLVEGRMLDEEA
ncbi:hypothetical protein G6O69_28075 [Pseudenhygromyxa sp. WMMC2535]|uniref:hypothetical protein n=1 Tax=Pseudenhygromyxa sp. WMMC2535 TaxID=2712867 RepID=UPI0015956DBB|nr:hypothetical protein [Pseudenhygromyxa sp. WMMC2535]NVB41724.1 hypothetical protein [Pseudenhygromyxa sp. WMMC2535]